MLKEINMNIWEGHWRRIRGKDWKNNKIMQREIKRNKGKGMGDESGEVKEE